MSSARQKRLSPLPSRPRAFATMLAEKTEIIDKGESSDGLDSDAESIKRPQQTLHRQLKNRHIAMIRCVEYFTFSATLILTFLKYWRCHRYWSFRRNSKRSIIRWSSWSVARLLNHGHHRLLRYDLFGRNGLFAAGPGHRSYALSSFPQVAFLPIAGGHIKLAERFVDPAFSFAMGWNFWYNWTIFCASL